MITNPQWIAQYVHIPHMDCQKNVPLPLWIATNVPLPLPPWIAKNVPLPFWTAKNVPLLLWIAQYVHVPHMDCQKCPQDPFHHTVRVIITGSIRNQDKPDDTPSSIFTLSGTKISVTIYIQLSVLCQILE